MKFFKYSLILVTIFVLAMGSYLFLDKADDIQHGEEPIQIMLEENIDWEPILIEATAILSDLIQIPTIRKDEDKAAVYIQKVLEKEGIQARLIPHPEFPDKVSVVAELGPEDAQNGLILLAHLDVVEADETKWAFPPFAGDVKDGKVLGRGALDMKGPLVMELMAFIMLHRKGIKLSNKVMFLGTPDEESGGKTGVQFLLDQHANMFDDYKYILTEGGFGINNIPNPGNKIFNVQTAEKGVLGVDVIARGQSGHGSMPDKNYSSLNLINFLKEMESISEFNLTPQVIEFFQTMSEFYSFPQNFILSRVQNPLVQKIAGSKIREKKSSNAMVSNTMSITNLETQTLGHNVIPAEAKAHLDIRVLPGVEPEKLFSDIQKIATKYNIEATITQSFPSLESTADTTLFEVLYSVLKDNVKDAKVTQYLSPGATDSRFFRQKGFICYGIAPILIPIEEVGMLHGKDESISLENLKLGTKVLFETVVGFNQLESL